MALDMPLPVAGIQRRKIACALVTSDRLLTRNYLRTSRMPPSLRRFSRSRTGFSCVCVLFLATVAQGCAINPVTVQREFVLISEGQEIQMGREADPEIVGSLGLVEDSAWQEYVQSLGEVMATQSERPNLPWTFRVVDDPVVNAFALPGGFIYVTRGILGHFSSEAELAGVLGHEIGHVTARHSVNQLSRAQLAQVGLGVGTILAPDLAPFAQAAEAGLGLLLLSYGRDAERQADQLGLRYMTREGYDPREMAATFEMLADASGASEDGRVPAFLSTHPNPLDRRDEILQRIEVGEVSGDLVARDEYLARLEGMPFGVDPRQGFFEGNAFYHPELAFQLLFPDGWQTQNGREAVQGINSEQDAAILLTLADFDSPQSAQDDFLSGSEITGSNRSRETVNGLPSASADFSASTQDGTFVGTVLFVEHGGRVFHLLGYASETQWDARSSPIRNAIRSFRPVTDPAVLNAQADQIELVRLTAEMTVADFNSRYPSSVPLETIATINHLELGDLIPVGTLVKRVVEGG